MIQVSLMIMVLLISNIYSEQNNCGCKCVSTSETTYEGHGFILVDPDERVVKTFRGTVIYPEHIYPKQEPVPETLVEVFDHPEAIPKTPSEAKQAQEVRRRVAACKTGENGKFCFDNLPFGKYELRYSKSGFEPTSLIINYDPDNSKSSKEEIEAEITIR